jgi:hypothetical protein
VWDPKAYTPVEYDIVHDAIFLGKTKILWLEWSALPTLYITRAVTNSIDV